VGLKFDKTIECNCSSRTRAPNLCWTPGNSTWRIRGLVTCLCIEAPGQYPRILLCPTSALPILIDGYRITLFANRRSFMHGSYIGGIGVESDVFYSYGKSINRREYLNGANTEGKDCNYKLVIVSWTLCLPYVKTCKPRYIIHSKSGRRRSSPGCMRDTISPELTISGRYKSTTISCNTPVYRRKTHGE